jgi:hypothetical protein
MEEALEKKFTEFVTEIGDMMDKRMASMLKKYLGKKGVKVVVSYRQQTCVIDSRPVL